MADARITELPLATTPLAGTELQEIVQGGVNKRVAVSEVGGGAGAGTWGSITGTLSSQTDLQSALDAKASLASPALTGTPTVPTAAPGTNTTQAASTAFVQAAAALDADLTAIGALTPTNDDVIQRKAGAWTNRSIAELKTDLDYGGVGTWVPVWTGFSADPTSIVAEYTLIGKLCIAKLQCVAGTSNATTLTVTLPFNASTTAIQRAVVQVTNNGVLQIGAIATQTTGTPVINCFPDGAAGAWTASGAKRVLFTFPYFIE